LGNECFCGVSWLNYTITMERSASLALNENVRLESEESTQVMSNKFRKIIMEGLDPGLDEGAPFEEGQQVQR